jgi:group I intron endonuclease
MMFLIYKITNATNGKVYIGQTTKPLQERFVKHCNSKSCKHLRNAIDKYGKDNFTIELLTVCGMQETTDYWERYFIKRYQSNNRKIGYNIRGGGKDGSTISQESRDIISRKNRGSGNGQSKLTEKIVNLIRLDDRSEPQIAKTYGVSRSTVGDIKHKRIWKHLTTPITKTNHQSVSGEEWRQRHHK